MITCLASVMALSAIAALAAQNAPDPPKFETASVKRADRCSMQNSIDPGIIALRGDPLKAVLMEAFQVKMDQIVGPSWLDDDCFEIVAKIPEGVPRNRIPAMLQALLAERFKLTAHKEVRLSPGYSLVIDKTGPKIKESDPDLQAFKGVRAGNVRFGATVAASGITGSMTIAALARQLSIRLRSPVEDLTRLTGKYNIDLSWAPDRNLEPVGAFAQAYADAHPNADLPDPPAADLFSALRESLGLRLDRRTLQVEIVVIDHIERVATEN